MKNILSKFSFLLLVVSLILLSTCKKNITDSGFKGRVTNLLNDQPIPGATVQLLPSGITKTTDSNGEYSIVISTDGLYTLKVDKSGFISQTKENLAIIDGDDQLQEVNFALEPQIPVLFVDKNLIEFGLSTEPQNFTVSNTGNGPLNFALTTNVNWINLNNTGGTLEPSQSATIQVTIVVANIPNSGLNSGKVTVTTSNGTGGPVEVVITAVKNSTPTPSFTISASSVFINQTFTVDASSSSDNETSVDNLQVRWSWNDDGIYTTWTSVKTSSYYYSTEGIKTIRLEVKDEQGLTASTTKQITVTQQFMAPSVVILPEFNLYSNFAMIGATILNVGTGSTSITEHGFCWGTTTNPSLESNLGSTENGTGQIGNFYTLINNLSSQSLYYVRAYAKNNNNQIAYSENRTFTTPQPTPVPPILSGWAESVTQSSAVVHGFLLNTGIGITILEKGFVYGTSANPTYSNFHVVAANPSITGEFVVSTTSLSPGITYYVKAYIKLSNGDIVYSPGQIEFSTNY